MMHVEGKGNRPMYQNTSMEPELSDSNCRIRTVNGSLTPLRYADRHCEPGVPKHPMRLTLRMPRASLLSPS